MSDKIKACPTCGKEISKNAVTCPHCGEVLKKSSKTNTAVGCGCLVVLIFMLIPNILGYQRAAKRTQGQKTESPQQEQTMPQQPTPQPTTEPITEPLTEPTPETTTQQIITNGVDPENWPDLAALNLPNSVMLNIFNDYEKAWETYPDDADVDTQEKYEAEVAQSISRNYNITPEQANSVYYYVTTNYAKVANDGADTPATYTLKCGDFISAKTNGSTIVINAKISQHWTNKGTLTQNYYNIFDLIKNQGLDIYEEIQYWAVADMPDGTQTKVISFTVPKETINMISNGSLINFEDLGDYVEDFWTIISE